jgi:CHAT domain-containing protein/tetratricopeptide (TPR) repeat protein
MNTVRKIFILVLFLIIKQSYILGFPDDTSTNKKKQDLCSYLVDLADQFANKGDFERTARLIKQSHELKKQLFLPNDPAIANSLVNLSIVYYYKWDFDSALIFLNQAEHIYLADKNSNNGYLGYVYALIGKIYYSKGEYDQAERYYSTAEQFLGDKKKEPFFELKIMLYLWYGALRRTIDNPASSIEYYQKCLHAIGHKSTYNNQMISLLIESSLTYSQIGQYNKSIYYQHKAIELCKKDTINYLLRLIILNENIAKDYLAIEKYEEAEKYFNKALSISNKSGLKGYYLSTLYMDFGEMIEKQKNYEKALEYYQTALKALVPGFLSDNPMDNPIAGQISAQLHALNILKAKTYCLQQIYFKNKKLKYLVAAISTSLLSIELIEELRNSYQTYESKLMLAGHEDETYKKALVLCSEAYKRTQDSKYITYAYTVSEKNKSSILLSSLRESNAINFGEIPDSILLKEKQLLKDITLYKEKIYEENQDPAADSVKIATWENYLFRVHRDHEQLIKQFESKYPGYYALKYDNSVIKPDRLQICLARNATLIEYAMADSTLFTFVISNNHFNFHQQKIDSSFFMHLKNYLLEYQQFDFSKQFYNQFTEFCRNSKEIYDVLIKPVNLYLRNDNLIIVPDGILSFLPFETLIDELPQFDSSIYYKNLNYMINKYNISYSYSSTIYSQTYELNNNRNTEKLLAFAPEYESNTAFDVSNQKIVTRQKYRKNLYPIPGVIDEVSAINSLIPSDIFRDKDATETNFKRVAGNYDILHLAMHTIIDNKNPMFSKLIFTLSDDTINDGLLNTYEIFSLKLKAKMVVLSACSTGEGDYSKSEGVMSLARGFVYAGSPSLIMTLWEVEDKSSVMLMKYFYKNLLKGQSKPEALRNAKLRFLKETKTENSHPFFWSSFVIMGNTKPLFSNLLNMLVLSTIIGVVLILLIVWKIRKK